MSETKKTIKEKMSEIKEVSKAILISLIAVLIAAPALSIAGNVTMPTFARYLVIFFSLAVLILTPFFATWVTVKKEIKDIEKSLEK